MPIACRYVVWLVILASLVCTAATSISVRKLLDNGVHGSPWRHTWPFYSIIVSQSELFSAEDRKLH